MNIALFGGSFNPPHTGHQLACLYLLEAEGFERVWLVPTYRHPFGKPLAPFPHRAAMCALVARPFGGRVTVCEVEQNLDAGEGNRTIDTVRHLKAHHPEERFTLVVGSDILEEASSWKDFDDLTDEVALLVLRRTGFEPGSTRHRLSALAFPEVSSTAIRQRCARGQGIHGLVPAPVDTYLDEHGLYRDHAGGTTT